MGRPQRNTYKNKTHIQKHTTNTIKLETSKMNFFVVSIFPFIINGSISTAKEVTDEQLAFNRQRILAENSRIADFMMSSKKSTSFLKSDNRIRVARAAESREEVRYTETQYLRDEYYRFEYAIEALAYAIQGNENVDSKAFEICKEAANRITSRTNGGGVSVFSTGVGISNSMAGFTLHGKYFTVCYP